MYTYGSCVWIVLVFTVGTYCELQCNPNDNIYFVQNNRCYTDYTAFDPCSTSLTIHCISKSSNAANGNWSYVSNFQLGATSVAVNCSDNASGQYCQLGNGTISLYIDTTVCNTVLNNIYTCCIDNDCIHAQFFSVGSFSEVSAIQTITNCSVTSVTSVTTVPQNFSIQMATINIPPTFYESNINVTVLAEGFTNGTPYYINPQPDIGAYTYQFIMPVSWNPTTSGFSNYAFQCYAVSVFNGAIDSSLTEIAAADCMPIIKYEITNNIQISWTCNGTVYGYVITVMNTEQNTVTLQHTVNTSTTDYSIDLNQLLRETNYTVYVRGYLTLIGAPGSVNILLSSNITQFNHTFLSPLRNLIKFDVLTDGITPNDSISWNINGITISNSSSYRMSSVLLDTLSYKYSLVIDQTLNTTTSITFNSIVNTVVKESSITLIAPTGPPTGVFAEILSSSSIIVHWEPSAEPINGYIVLYAEDELIETEDVKSLSAKLTDLIEGNIYNISVLSYIDLPSEQTKPISILLQYSPTITCGNITQFNHTFLSPLRNLIEFDAFTIGITPNDSVSWSINGITISNSSSYRMSSVLLDTLSYKYSLVIDQTLTTTTSVTFNSTTETCPITSVITLTAPSGPPAGVSVKILSSSSIIVHWEPSTEPINGYIVLYAEDELVEIEDGESLSAKLTDLIEGNVYKISVLSYIDLPSEQSEPISIVLDSKPNTCSTDITIVIILSVIVVLLLIIIIVIVSALVIGFLIYRSRKFGSFFFRINRPVKFANPALPELEEYEVYDYN